MPASACTTVRLQTVSDQAPVPRLAPCPCLLPLCLILPAVPSRHTAPHSSVITGIDRGLKHWVEARAIGGTESRQGKGENPLRWRSHARTLTPALSQGGEGVKGPVAQ